jgi:hypothetical protein
MPRTVNEKNYCHEACMNQMGSSRIHVKLYAYILSKELLGPSSQNASG